MRMMRAAILNLTREFNAEILALETFFDGMAFDKFGHYQMLEF